MVCSVKYLNQRRNICGSVQGVKDLYCSLGRLVVASLSYYLLWLSGMGFFRLLPIKSKEVHGHLCSI